MNQRKKIKILTGISDFRIGGAQKIVIDILKGIDTATYEVELVTFFDTKDEATFYSELPSHVRVHTLAFRNFYDVRAWLSTLALLRRSNPDVVWSHLFFSNTVVRLLKFICGYKVIVVEHNTYPNRTKMQRFLDRILSLVTYRIVAVAPGVVDFLVRDVGISKQKCVVIQNGIAIKQIQAVSKEATAQARLSIGIGPSDRYIVTVGQLIRQKNHRLLLEAFALFVKKYQSYKLVIIGEGVKRSELETQIKTLAIEDRVLLPGIKKPVAPFLSGADFFVLPSLFEGFGIVCIEAMAVGLPVISTRVTGPDVYIKEGENGVFCDLTTESLLEKMEQFAELDESSKAQLAQGARQTAATYDVTEVTLRYQALFAAAAAD